VSGPGSFDPRLRLRKSVVVLDKLGLPAGSPAADEARVRQFEQDKQAAREHLARVLTVFYVLNAAVFLFVVTVWLSERIWPPRAIRW